MGSLTDNRFNSLRSQGFTGSTSDMILQWLKANGATSNSIPDAWSEMLVSKGVSPIRTEGWWELLDQMAPSDVGRSMSDLNCWFWSEGGGSFDDTDTFVLTVGQNDPESSFYGYSNTSAGGEGLGNFGGISPGSWNGGNFIAIITDGANLLSVGFDSLQVNGLTSIWIAVEGVPGVLELVWNGSNAYFSFTAPGQAAAIAAASGSDIQLILYDSAP